MRRILILLFTLVVLTRSALAQVNNLSQIEKRISSCIEKAYAASVRIWGYDTVRHAQNSSQFSGVVVSNEGHILTVAHAIVPHKLYKVRFPDGREVMAIALGRIGFAQMQNRPDLGMMKIFDKGSWPIAEIGWSYSLNVNEPCISISYPERLNQLFPTVRFGRITNGMDQWGFVQSSCKMEPGDSGGPLFDLKGRVVALHSRCEAPEVENFEVPVDMYRKYWDALHIPEDYQELPADTNYVSVDSMPDNDITLQLLKNVEVIFPVKDQTLNLSCMVIQSEVNGVSTKAMGTFFTTGGKNYLVSKSSIVGSYPKIIVGKQLLQAMLLKRDYENDLVLLQLNGKFRGGLPLDVLKKPVSNDIASLGRFLISPLPGQNKVSVIGSMTFNQPRVFSGGYLGAPAKYRQGMIILSSPVTNSPADVSGLKEGDQINRINDVKLNKAEDYGHELVKYDPYDTVNIQGIRSDSNFSVNIMLGLRPPGKHAAEKFEGGKSARLDGFRKVFAHDASIKPEECGGPVFDAAGNFYGINIARFSRTVTLAISAEAVADFIFSILSP